MELQPLIVETQAPAVELIPQAHLLTAAAVKAALAHCAVDHPPVAHLHVRTQPAQGQGLGRLGMAFQGNDVAEPIAQAGGSHTRAIGKITDRVVTTQVAGGHREIRQAFLQQCAGDIERQGGRHLPAEGIGSHHHRLPCTVDERHVGQGIGPRLQVGAGALVAVDEQVHR
ncbi:hypothetical protein D9M71_670570 [compost metagenome]